MITKQEIQPVITKKVVITDSLFASYVNSRASAPVSMESAERPDSRRGKVALH